MRRMITDEAYQLSLFLFFFLWKELWIINNSENYASLITVKNTLGKK